jgi:integrase
MLRDDLLDAGIPAVVKRRGVEYHAGFHALRYATAAMLRRGGVSLRDAQARMRHSDQAFTANVYQALKLEHEAAVIESMPSLEPDARATGTDRA